MFGWVGVGALEKKAITGPVNNDEQLQTQSCVCPENGNKNRPGNSLCLSME